MAEFCFVFAVALTTLFAMLFGDQNVATWYLFVFNVGILVAVLLAISTRKMQQVYWIGFCVSTFAYLSYFNTDSTDPVESLYDRPEATAKFLTFVYRMIHIDDPSFAETLSDELTTGHGVRLVSFREVEQEADGLVNKPQKESEVDFKDSNSLVIRNEITVIEYHSLDPLAAFFAIGHSGWALLFGWIGGYVTIGLHARNRVEKI